MVILLGVIVMNGLIVVYNCGYRNEIEGFRGNFCFYLNEIGILFVYYKEFVFEVIGDFLGLFLVEIFDLVFYEIFWFKEVVLYFIDNLIWMIGCSLISKYCYIVYYFILKMSGF